MVPVPSVFSRQPEAWVCACCCLVPILFPVSPVRSAVQTALCFDLSFPLLFASCWVSTIGEALELFVELVGGKNFNSSTFLARHDDIGLETNDYACLPLCSFAHACEGRSPQAGTPKIAIAT
uniref:Uncharacterized protein n=1 Tax=Ananas comosus var. bracteatus TaxID=296719 RepID=A0A6V7PT17_ANACO|nr:unnamed protein product [Ananas comosus var. bracteatus]